MATTLLNDSAHASNIVDKLIEVAKILWIDKKRFETQKVNNSNF